MRRARWDELRRSFAAGPVLPEKSVLAAFANVEWLRAAAAYAENPSFAWTVAFGALCHLKAASRAPVACTGEFADVMAIPLSAGRVLEQSRQLLYANAGVADAGGAGR